MIATRRGGADSLPSELWGCVFQRVPDRERCRTLPLVCKDFWRIHREHPPPRTQLEIHRTITAALLDWFLVLAPTLVRLELHLTGEPGMVGQILAFAAVSAPRLRKLTLTSSSKGHHKDSGGGVLGSLALLKQITHLELQWGFRQRNNGNFELQSLSGLLSLETLCLRCDVNHTQPNEGALLWGALAKLQKLSSFTFRNLNKSATPQHNPYAVSAFLQSISQLTQLRSVTLVRSGSCRGEGGLLPSGLAALTQLAHLEILGGVPAAALAPILGLPSLQSLRLSMKGNKPMRPLALRSTALTCLEIDGGCSTSKADETFPLAPGLPALSSLQHLRLNGLNLSEFPEAMATALTSLTSLNLYSNRFSHIPHSIRHMTDLRVLDMGENSCLGLDMDIIQPLAALPSLGYLGLMKGNPSTQECGFSMDSVRALFAIRERLPGLFLPGFMGERVGCGC